MATVNAKAVAIQNGVLQTTWAMTGADTGTPDQLSRYPLHSVEIVGTFGGGTYLLEGSDEESGTGTYFTLKDVSGTSITTTSAARFDTLAIVPRHIRPRSTGGDGTSAVNVIVTSRMNFGR